MISEGFQSTPSVWRATGEALLMSPAVDISIHALRVEGDIPERGRMPLSALHFNPRPPCGGRRGVPNPEPRTFLFQSTPSVWRATVRDLEGEYIEVISIHALRVEGDAWPSWSAATSGNFNPRPPCGGRRVHVLYVPTHNQFQSTPSVWRATLRAQVLPAPLRISIHALRVEGDTRKGGLFMPYADISIHALRVEGDSRTSSIPRKRPYFNPRPPCGGRLHKGSATKRR